MGMILEPTEAMGEYRVEVRRESFYLHGEGDGSRRHAVIVYPGVTDNHVGTAEILLEDILKIRACLDEIERYVKERS